MKDLLDIRNEIDGIDRQIVELFENRMILTTQVAEYKISTGKAVFDKEREVQNWILWQNWHILSLTVMASESCSSISCLSAENDSISF